MIASNSHAAQAGIPAGLPSQASSPAFRVGAVPVHGDLVLSPMDGYSDWPFRSLCRALGSAISYTEFVSVNDLLQRPAFVAAKLHFTAEERPVAIQIYGDDVQRMVEGALRAQELGPDFIDVNMGCPSQSIASRGAGVGLMRTPLKIARILRALTTALEVPVTAKIRLGWDQHCLTYRLAARIIEQEGGQLIAVHGRTKVQAYRGAANWEAIAEVVQAVKIPVLGNGDVNTAADIERMKSDTGCVGVMIGRAAIRNPWIFARLEREQVSPQQVRETLLAHLARNLQFYGSERGLVLFRKYAAHYLAPHRLPKEFRHRLLTCEQPATFLALVEEFVTSQ